MRFKKNYEILQLMDREMQQFSDEAFRTFFNLAGNGSGRFWQPPVDVHETEHALLVKMELAGANAEDLQVSLSSDDRILTISGARAETRSTGSEDSQGRVRCHQLEIYFGPFERAVALPSGVPVDREQIAAVYRHGFLLVTLPKKRRSTEKPKTRMIPISETADETLSPTLTESED